MSRSIQAIYPLTPLQHGMLHHSLAEPGTGLYIEQFVCTLSGDLDPIAFEGAWSDVMRQTDVLRTLFIRLRQTQPLQVVKAEAVLPFEYSDWSAKDEEDCRASLDELMAADRAKDFDLSAAPLMRLRLVKMGPERHRFIWTYHHAVLDGWSLPIVLEAMLDAYAARRDGKLPEAGDPGPLAFRRYVRWMMDKDEEAAQEYWQGALGDVTAPASLSRRTGALSSRRSFGVRRARLDAAWLEDAEAFAKRQGVTLSALCQTAWAGVVARYAGRQDVLVGTVASGRTMEIPAIAGMPGLFIKTLPARLRFKEETPVGVAIQSLQRSVALAEENGHLTLPEITRCADLPPKEELFQSIFAFENYPGHQEIERVSAQYGLDISDADAVEETNFPLAVIAVPSKALDLKLVFDRSAVPGPMASSLLSALEATLRAMTEGQGKTPFARLLSEAMPGVAEDLPAMAAPDGEGRRQSNYAALIDDWAESAADSGALVGDPLSPAAIARDGAALADMLDGAGLEPGETVGVCGSPAAVAAQIYAATARGLSVLPLPDDRADGMLPEGVPLHAKFRPGVAGETTVERGPSLPEASDQDGEPGFWLVNWSALREREARFMPAGRMKASLSALSSLWREESAEPARLAILSSDDVLPTVESILLSAIERLALSSSDDPLSDLSAEAEGTVVRMGPAASRRAAASNLFEAWAAEKRGPAILAMDAVAAPAALSTLGADMRFVAEHRICDVVPPVGASWTDDPAAAASRMPHDDIVPGLKALVVDAEGAALPDFAIGALMVVAGDGERVQTHRLAFSDGKAVHLLGGAGVFGQAQPDRLRQLAARIERNAGAPVLFLGEVALPSGGPARLCLVEESAGDLSAIRAQLEEGAAEGEAILLGTIEAARWAEGDRANLLSSQIERLSKAAYAPPGSDDERKIHAIWAALLEDDGFGIHDDYFALGGQSLSVTVMLYELVKTFGIEVTVEEFSQKPTVAHLAEVVDRRRRGDLAPAGPRDLRPKVVLEDHYMRDADGPAYEAPFSDVLLTGATGFLGTQLLADLCDRTESRVHCLVRAKTAEEGAARIEKAMRRYELWQEAYRDRIEAVPGDLDKPLFGLDADRFEELGRAVQAIYHNGALVNFVLGYDQLVPANVTGTKTIIALATTGRAKPVHYVSTVGTLDRLRPKIEESFEVEWHENLGSGYEQSKWVAERILGLAAKAGLPVSIYRPSRIVGHSRTGALNADDLFCRFLQGAVHLGAAPKDAGWDNMVPVDYASGLIVEASTSPSAAGKGFHVISPRWNPFDEVLDALEESGFAIERLGYGDWLARLVEASVTDPDNPLAPLIPVLQRLNPERDPSVSARMPIMSGNLAAIVGQDKVRDIPAAKDQCGVFLQRLVAEGSLPAPQRKAS